MVVLVEFRLAETYLDSLVIDQRVDCDSCAFVISGVGVFPELGSGRGQQAQTFARRCSPPRCGLNGEPGVQGHRGSSDCCKVPAEFPGLLVSPIQRPSLTKMPQTIVISSAVGMT